MPSSVREAAAAAALLLGARPRLVEQRRGGGNNRVYRVENGTRSYALKGYPAPGNDPRDRLGHEFDALRFLRERGITAVPRAYRADRENGWALYEWIDGEPVVRHDVRDIAAMVEFLRDLDAAARHPGARELPPAAEAVFAPHELDRQVEARLARFAAVADGEPELADVLAAVRARWAELQAQPRVAAGRRTLSPSDFGFHNALRRPDGTLTFLDFEYFGWDDPVKLVSDVLWHPGMQLSAAERAAFRDGALVLYADEPGFAERLRRDAPRYGVRWALIVLNEFLPEAWERRVAAGRTDEWAHAKAEQAAKARALLQRTRDDADI